MITFLDIMKTSFGENRLLPYINKVVKRHLLSMAPKCKYVCVCAHVCVYCWGGWGGGGGVGGVGSLFLYQLNSLSFLL